MKHTKECKPSKRKVGEEFENRAVEYLEGLGYKILERNVNYPWGELDVIAEDPVETDLVFVEVRKKSARGMSSAAESISVQKLARIKGAAETWLADPKNEHIDRKYIGLRIDLVGFHGLEPFHWKNIS